MYNLLFKLQMFMCFGEYFPWNLYKEEPVILVEVMNHDFFVKYLQVSVELSLHPLNPKLFLC